MTERLITTLFLIESVDGKISSGDTDEMDVDKDWKNIPGVAEGLHQYYDIEKTTDFFSLNSGKVFAKIGFNEKQAIQDKIPVTFVVIDNQPHLTENGLKYLSHKGKQVIIVTTNPKHPAFAVKGELGNIEIIKYDTNIDFTDLFQKLKTVYGAERMTIQTGGTLNAVLVRNNLIDFVSVVVAPLLVGGKNTPTLVDGESLHAEQELFNLQALELVECKQLENSYLHLIYKVRK